MDAVNYKKTRRLSCASLSSELTPSSVQPKGETKTKPHLHPSLTEPTLLLDRHARKHLENLMSSSMNGYNKTKHSSPESLAATVVKRTTQHHKHPSFSGPVQPGLISSKSLKANQSLTSRTSGSSIPSVPKEPRDNSIDSQSRRSDAEGMRSKIPQVSQQVNKQGNHTDRGGMVEHLISTRRTSGQMQQPAHEDTVPKLSISKKYEHIGFGSFGGIDQAKTDRPRDAVVATTNNSRAYGTMTARARSPRKSSRNGGQDSARSSLAPSMSHTGPMSVPQVLHRYADLLTDFEQSEILHYPQIYFVGKTSHKVKGTPHSTYLNHGYDDERGDYATVAHDHIGYRYEIVSTLGKGSFGQVLKCYDHKRGTFVALKIIRNKKRFHHQAMIEVKVLDMLRRRDIDDSHNVVHLKEYFVFRNHLCITFELMSINLYELIKQNNFEGVSLGLTKRFAIQILRSLSFLRELRIVHCDLKPENILLKQPDRSAVKVIDFGSSCLEDETRYTYIQSRFYRAPEVILGLPYGTPIDMWSLGCILAELYTGCPIFPGENEQEQLLCIMEVLGVPPRSMLTNSTKWKMFFDSSYRPRVVTSSRGKKRLPGSRDLASKTRCRDRLFLTFLEGCFKWEPSQRMTPEEALQHPWMTEHTRPATQRQPQTHPSANHSAPFHPLHPQLKPGWNNTNNGNAKTTIVPQPQPVVQVNPGALSSRRSEHRSIQTDRRRLPQPVVSTTIMKNRPPIETILPKLLALRQN